jgi:NitT/TauT family transport system permease protein
MLRQAYTKNEVTTWPIPNYWDVVAVVVVCAIIILFASSAKGVVAPFHVGDAIPISLDPRHLPEYAMRTFFRLFIALLFSLLFTFVVGTAAAKNRHAERLIIPVIDILQSAPVLSFLAIMTPIFIAMFHHSMLGPECAAIFAVFTSQVWNMTLSFYQSLRTVPNDLKEAASIFRLSMWQKFWRIEVPFAMPGLLWNMMMSMSGSWFFVAATESFPFGNANINLPGIGSYISLALAQGDKLAFAYAILCMLIVIFLYDQIMFRPLVYWAERFKGEQEEDGKVVYSLVVHLFQSTKLLRYASVWLLYLGEWFVNPPWWKAWRRYSERRASIASGTTAVNHFTHHFAHHSQQSFVVAYYILLVLALGAAVWLVVNFAQHAMAVLGMAELKKVVLLGFFTGIRVMVLVAVAALIWVPVGVWIGLRPSIAARVQPLVQFLAAFPANLLFPLVAFLFLKYKMNVEIWVAPLMVLGTQWYILFNVIAGASALPKDLRQTAAMLKVRGWLRWRRLLLPGIAPYFVTGAITAAGGAWNASIVAEVISWQSVTLEATGLGAYITSSFTQNNSLKIVLGTIVMCIFVLFINRVFWRPLYNFAVKKYSM